jgi:phage tail-like protein
MRGLVAGLVNPHPLGRGLPGVYQEEDLFTMRLTEAFDEILAPVISTLDNLPAYFDPATTPEDFLTWLSGWVAFDLDETWDLGVRRRAVSRAVDLLRRRGTASGLADEVTLVTGGEVEVVENGGTAWSLDPSSPMAGSPSPALVVRIRVDDPSGLDLERLDRVVAAAKPAHVPHRIEVVGGGGGKAKRTRSPAPGGGPAGAPAASGGTSRSPAAAAGASAGDAGEADAGQTDAGSPTAGPDGGATDG